MTDEEIRQVEHIVNAKIRANIPLKEYRNIPIEEAKELGIQTDTPEQLARYKEEWSK